MLGFHQPLFYVLVFIATFLAVDGVLMLISGGRNARRSSGAKRLRTMGARLQAPAQVSGDTLLRSRTTNRPFWERLLAWAPEN